MRRKLVSKFKRGFAFIEIILVALIIMFLLSKLLNSYFKKAGFDKETQKSLSEQGIDTTSQESTIRGIENKLKDIQDIQTRHINRLEEYE